MKDDQPFTMKDLLDLLTARELESGEDSLRLALLNFNGLAGIYLIQNAYEQTRPTVENNNEQENYLQLAVTTYEKVVDISRMYQVDFHVDSFQLAHTYYNLSYALTFSDPQLTSRWTSDGGRKEFDQIKQRYQTQSIEEMNETWKKYNEKLLPGKEFERESNGLLADLSDAIKSIENEQIDLSYYLNRDQQLPFSNWNGFLYHLTGQFDQLKRIRETLLLGVENLERQPTDEQTAQMAACAKCGFDNDASNENSCLFCEIEPSFKSYHCR